MSKEGGETQEIDLKFFIKYVHDQFKKLNARLDDLESSSGSELHKRRHRKHEFKEEDANFIMEERTSCKWDKKIMVVQTNGEIKSANSCDEEIQLVKDCSNVEMEEHVHRDSLFTKRVLNISSKDEEDDKNYDHIFHTRCHVKDKVCALIIDSMSYTNVASTLLVEKLNLKWQENPKPYKLPWLNECGGMEVNKQVWVPFSIGKYEEEVLCDVAPIYTAYILLSRPW